MATTSNIREVKFRPLIRPAGDTTQDLLGNIYEEIEATIKVDVFSAFAVPDYIFSTQYLSSNSVNFLENQVSVGDMISFHQGDNSNQFISIFEVNAVNENTIYFNGIGGNPQFGEFSDISNFDYIFITTPLNYLKYSYGLGVDENYTSWLDGETMSHEVKNLTTSFQSSFQKSAINSNYGTFSARKTGTFIPPVTKNYGQQNGQSFEVVHRFLLQDYRISEIENYQKLFKSDNYIGQNSLNYWVKTEFRAEEKFNNTAKIGNFSFKSNVGFLNENLNEGQNRYKVSNVIYKRSNGDFIDGIAISEPCSVEFTLKNTGGFFGVSEKIQVIFKALVQDFEFKQIDYVDLFKFSRAEVGGSNGVITSVSKIVISPTEIKVTVGLNISDNSLADTPLLLACICENQALLSKSTDKETVLVSVENGVTGFDIEGLITDADLLISMRDATKMQAVNQLNVIKAELLRTYLDFTVTDGEIVGVEQLTIGINSGKSYIIDQKKYDFDFILVDGLQEIDTIISNEYTSGYDGLFIHNGGGAYSLVDNWRVPFDGEVEAVGLPDFVYDSSKPLDGFGQDLLHLQSKSLTIHLAYRINVLKDNIITTYQIFSPVLEVSDFETFID